MAKDDSIPARRIREDIWYYEMPGRLDFTVDRIGKAEQGFVLFSLSRKRIEAYLRRNPGRKRRPQKRADRND